LVTNKEQIVSESREKGRQVVREMLGEEFLGAMDAAAASGGFGADAASLALENAFGDAWARPGLDRRSRSLVTLGMLIAQRTPWEFSNHVRIGLANGLTEKELEEVVLHAIPYVGFPAVSIALKACKDVLGERVATVQE
jgi:4-carboxymuconolactone decarboxylase